MNFTLSKKKNNEVPTLFTDWLSPTSFFGSMLNDMESNMAGRLGVTLPSANIKETEKDFQIELAAPGLKREDFKVDLENNLLTIRSEKEEEKKEEKGDYARREYAYNSFSRSFYLPENSLGDKIEAKYVDGILKVKIPKKEVTASKPKKRISIT